MIKKTCGVLAAGLLLGLVSCSDENPWAGESGHGAINLSLTASGSLQEAAPETRGANHNFFEAPSVDEFSIELEKLDGSYFKQFASVSDFLREKSFPAGTYNIRALYGNLEENEGFDMPHFAGTTQFTIREGETTDVTLQASVAHSVITIEYSDAFKNYFSAYSTTLHSEGHGYVTFEQGKELNDEGGKRAAYVAPGSVSLAVSFTNHQGQSVTVEPDAFLADAAHHYNLKFDVEGENYDATLGISFDDGLTREDVEIDLTEDLYTAPAPKINTTGFEVSENPEEPTSVDFLVGNVPSEKYRFDILSYGGIKEASLTVSSVGDYKPEWGAELNLINAAPAQQTQLANAGVEVKGLFKNPDRMAYVDFTNYIARLPKGRYIISMKAKDNLGRVSDPASLALNMIATELNVNPESGVAIFGLNTGTLDFNYNGSTPETAITFEAENKFGTFEKCEATFNLKTRTRAFEQLEYEAMLKLPDFGTKDKVAVKVYLFGEYNTTVNLNVQMPEFTIEVDPFATKAWVKIVASEAQLTSITKLVKFEENSNILSRDEERGLIMVGNYEAGKSYTLTPILGSKKYTDQAKQFTTETEVEIVNGDFSQMSTTINISNMFAGGKYSYTFFVTGIYQNYTSFSVKTPDNWNTTNNLTCDKTGSSNPNTWYVVPSAIGDEIAKSVKLRTVGYNKSGRELSTFETNINNFYSQNSPDLEDFVVSPGKLYLGSIENEGISFTSRPSGLTFGYEYAPLNNETGEAIILVYSNGQEIGKGTATVSSGNGNKSVEVVYSGDAFGKKATSLAVILSSSSSATPAIKIPTGTELKDNQKNTAPDVRSMTANDGTRLTGGSNIKEYKSLATGSELTISNVKLNY